jgi:hypothetical protein
MEELGSRSKLDAPRCYARLMLIGTKRGQFEKSGDESKVEVLVF